MAIALTPTVSNISRILWVIDKYMCDMTSIWPASFDQGITIIRKSELEEVNKALIEQCFTLAHHRLFILPV